MTTNDIISHKYGVRQFYKMLRPMTIADAAQEPLKIADLLKMPNRVGLPTGHSSDFATALCFVCIQQLLDKYSRKKKPDWYEIEYIANEMVFKYKHWSVSDLPTFVSMCIGARLPSFRMGEQEFELVVLDIPGIMGKIEVYDKMRPNPQALQCGSPIRRDEKPLTQYQLTHKIGGIEYKWPSYQECWRYWKGELNTDDPDEKNFYDSVNGKRGEVCKKV